MNSKIVQIRGHAFHLPGKDMDTDRIIPARFLKCVVFDGLGEHVFEDDRKQLAGKHPFDLPENKRRTILFADENFACGSSREHAVPALMQWGVKAIIALSFAEIFRGNAVGNGLVCIQVTPEMHETIAGTLRRGNTDFFIDLERMKIQYRIGDEPDQWAPAFPCTMPAAHRDMLITGEWDQISTTLEAGDAIEKTEASLALV